MCLAGYAGAFASNEVVESKVSEELELNNYVDSIDSTLSDNNCWGQFKMKKGDGEAEVFGYATNASSEDNCNEKMKKLFLTMLVGLASYSGVYASSSEEAKDTNLIKDIEVLNTQNLEIIQNDKIDESDYNCVSSVKMK